MKNLAIVFTLSLILMNKSMGATESFPASGMGSVDEMWTDDCTGKPGNSPVVWFRLKGGPEVFGFYGNTDMGKIWLSNLMMSMTSGLGIQVSACTVMDFA